MKAYFVRNPRTIHDLQQPHLPKEEQAYKIVKTVDLPYMDYENFYTDMVADRQFIEDNASLCSEGKVWECLFVHEEGRKSGILVMPSDGPYVRWAAYTSGK